MDAVRLNYNNVKMQKSKLGIDFGKVAHAKKVAGSIAVDVQKFVDSYTTVAVERTLCRLLGIDGVDGNSVPLPNVLVDEVNGKGVLGEGVMFFIGNAIIETGLSPQQIAEEVSAGKLDIVDMPVYDRKEIAEALQPYVDESIGRIRARRAKRES